MDLGMSNFVTKLFPLLPASLQFEEIADAASHFNQFSERLSAIQGNNEERQLVKSEWERALKVLLSCKDGEATVLYDNMSIVTYICLIDHWSLDTTSLNVAWIGKLLYSERLKDRRLGSLAASVPSMIADEYEGQDTAGLLLANTICKVPGIFSLLLTHHIKMLDSGCPGIVALGLSMARDHMSQTSWPLFSNSILRSLRSRHKNVRKIAWITAGKLLSFESSIFSEIESNWDHLVTREADVDIICSILSFLNLAPVDITKVLKDWVMFVQGKVLESSGLPILQCKLFRLLHKYNMVNSDLLKRMLRHSYPGNELVVLEILRKADILEIQCMIPIHNTIGRLFADDENFYKGLAMLEPLARFDGKSVLRYQAELLKSLDSDDPNLRLLAMKVLIHAANEENWVLLLENCKKIISLSQPLESECILTALKLSLKLISRFKSAAFLEMAMTLLDSIPESVGEFEADRVFHMLMLVSGNHKCDIGFATREYALTTGHSILHDLILVKLLGASSFFDPKFATSLLTEILEKALNIIDPAIISSIITSILCRSKEIGHVTDNLKNLVEENKAELMEFGLSSCLLNTLHDSENSPHRTAFEILEREFDNLFSEETVDSCRIDEQVPSEESEPEIEPTSLEKLEITSDVFKGLL